MSTDNDKIHIYKIMQNTAGPSSSNQPVSVSHCLIINENLTWKLYVHQKVLHHDNCAALHSFSLFLKPSTVNSFLEKLDSLRICIGNPDNNFIELCEAQKGRILSPDGSVSAFVDSFSTLKCEGESYSSTVRTTKCDMIVTGNKCKYCKKYRSVLRAMCSRHKKSPPSSERSDVSSHTNYRYLSTPEKITRLANLHSKFVQEKRKLEDLKQKVNNLTVLSGVEVDDQLSSDLSGIMDEMTEEVDKNYGEDSFGRVFWHQQLEARKLNDPRQIRWHPAIIKWCLNLKLLSSSSYHALRSSGVLSLPSERTLRDYTQSDAGFNESVDRNLMKEASIEKVQDFQKACLFGF